MHKLWALGGPGAPFFKLLQLYSSPSNHKSPGFWSHRQFSAVGDQKNLRYNVFFSAPYHHLKNGVIFYPITIFLICSITRENLDWSPRVHLGKMSTSKIPICKGDIPNSSWMTCLMRKETPIFDEFSSISWGKEKSNFWPSSKLAIFPKETNIELHIGDFLCMAREDKGELEHWQTVLWKCQIRPNDACNKKWPKEIGETNKTLYQREEEFPRYNEISFDVKEFDSNSSK